MSRSRKRNPYCSWTCCGDRAGVESKYKRRCRRQLRWAARLALLLGIDPPVDKEFGNPWCGPKDGKQRWLDERCYRK